MNAHPQVTARRRIRRLGSLVRPAWLHCAALLLAALLLAPTPGAAARLSLQRQEGHERLTIVLDEAPTASNVLRDSRTSLSLTLPAGYWDAHPKPGSLGPGTARLLKRVEPTAEGLRIELASPSFGYIHQLDGSTITVDLFADPLGARWTPAASPPPPAPSPATGAANATTTMPSTAPSSATANASVPTVEPPMESAARSLVQRNATPAPPPVTPPPAVTQPVIPPPPVMPPPVTPPVTAPVTPPVVSLPPRQPWNLRAPVLQRQWGDPLPGASAVASTPQPASSQPAPPAPSLPSPLTPPVTLPPPPPMSEAAPVASPVAGSSNGSSPQQPAVSPPGDGQNTGSQDGNGTLAENARKERAGAAESPDPGWIMSPEEALKALAPPPPEEGAAANASKPYVPDFAAIINSARAAMVNGDYNSAITIFETLRTHPQLPKKFVEEVLYTLADAHYAKAKEDFRTHYDTLTSLLTAAMNHNAKSPRVPEALLKMGLINLRVGNAPEAEAYFSMLLRQYPDDPNVPLVYYYQGKNFFDQGQFQEAADKFQYIVQQYPDSRHVREAAVGLSEALYKLGYDAQALQIVDYIEKRWPRFYVEYPPILKLGGEVAARNAAWERARMNYWTYYNLSPDGDDADIILARIGDVYIGQNSTAAAREIYQQSAARYPGKDGGLISLMRLAENGVHDTPSVQEMFTVFDKPFSTQPADIYERILKEHPESSLAPLARLKLAMWRLFNNQEREALGDVERFLADYPKHELTPQALDAAGRAFETLIADQAGQENYAGIVILCNDHPQIAQQLDKLPAATQTAMALAFWKTGQPARALSIVEPLLDRPGMPVESEMALQLATSIYLENHAWDKIAGLSEKVQDWELSPRAKDEFDYALALAYENLQSPEKSQAIWQELADKQDLGVNRIAYTKYFLAMEARKRQNLKAAYDHGLDALSYFLESGEDESKVMDLLYLLMDISDMAGRPRDALKWGIEFGKRLNPDDSRWPAMRYRTAQLYKKVQDVEQWRAILQELASQMPTSPYGRMAAMDLKGEQLEEGMLQYAPPSL